MQQDVLSPTKSSARNESLSNNLHWISILMRLHRSSVSVRRNREDTARYPRHSCVLFLAAGQIAATGVLGENACDPDFIREIWLGVLALKWLATSLGLEGRRAGTHQLSNRNDFAGKYDVANDNYIFVLLARLDCSRVPSTGG
jgi:hypothetical protein